jgi:hypothetical protein
MVFARQIRIEIPIFDMPCGRRKAGLNQYSIFCNAVACMVFARQIPIGNVTSIDTSKENACVYTFEQEFSTSLLHMRPIGFKSSTYYTQM